MPFLIFSATTGRFSKLYTSTHGADQINILKWYHDNTTESLREIAVKVYRSV